MPMIFEVNSDAFCRGTETGTGMARYKCAARRPYTLSRFRSARLRKKPFSPVGEKVAEGRMRGPAAEQNPRGNAMGRAAPLGIQLSDPRDLASRVNESWQLQHRRIKNSPSVSPCRHRRQGETEGAGASGLIACGQSNRYSNYCYSPA